ncbi:MAG: PspA/IM30 family protein [Spirochaetales bacterium]|nr:PspA/IM30 family protein [Spirochaetales bacterium]
MSVFKRIKDIVNSNINSLLDKAEDPEKMLKLMISEMDEAIIDIKASTSKKMADLKGVEKRKIEAEKAVSRWQERAELAVVKGSDEMAKEAIKERKAAEEILETFNCDYSALEKEVEEGKKELETLQEKLEEAKARLATLPPKKEEVKVKEEKKAKPAMRPGTRFEEMENRINRLEAYRELSAKKEEIKKEEKTMEEKLADLEIEDEIARIKKDKGLAL